MKFEVKIIIEVPEDEEDDVRNRVINMEETLRINTESMFKYCPYEHKIFVNKIED